MIFRRRPAISPRRIEAKDVRAGQTIIGIPGETVLPRRGVWPTVTSAEYLERGEGGRPTVYIESSEKPGLVWCLNPDDAVIISAD